MGHRIREFMGRRILVAPSAAGDSRRAAGIDNALRMCNDPLRILLCANTLGQMRHTSNAPRIL